MKKFHYSLDAILMKNGVTSAKRGFHFLLENYLDENKEYED